MAEISFDTIWDRAQHIPSPFMPKEHAQQLYDMAIKSTGIIVEIGSWQGRSSVILGSAIKKKGKGHLYCVDHWNLFNNAECIMDIDIWRVWNNHINEWGLQNIVTPVRSHSEGASNQWSESKRIDLLFIDGWHEYRESGPLLLSQEVIREYGISGWKINGELVPPNEYQPTFNRGAKVDFDLWSSKIKEGGVLIMHDILSDHPGVERVWREDVKLSSNWTVLSDQNGIGISKKIYTF